MEPARSLWGAGGRVLGALVLGSNYCDTVLLTAKTASSHFQRTIVKSFYSDETAADTCQSQRLPTEHNTWKSQRQRVRGRRRSRSNTCTRAVVNRKSGIIFFFLMALRIEAAASRCQNFLKSLVKKHICNHVVDEDLLLNKKVWERQWLKAASDCVWLASYWEY